MSPNTKKVLLIVGSVLAIAGSGLWIYYRDVKAPAYNVALHERIGEIMAEQTAKVVGNKGKLVVITIPTRDEPELQTQLNAFRRKLKLLGQFDLKDHQLDTKDQPKYSLGAGLSGRRFVRTVRNNPKADAIISFVGAPKLTDEDIAELQHPPKFIAETKSPDHLPKLFEKNLIQIAVASRFVFPAPGPQTPRTPQDWFNKRYQIVAADSVRDVPAPDGQAQSQVPN
jgi:hypothetical protein